MTALIPVSFFNTTKNNDCHDPEQGFFLERDWTSLVEEMVDISKMPLSRKEDAILLCPCRFENGLRGAKNAIYSSMIVYDVDHGMTWEDAWSIFQETGLTCLFYTTASHQAEGEDRFRILIPLAARVTPKQYCFIWLLLNQLFGEEQIGKVRHATDKTKKTCESMFYLPAQYAGRDNRIEMLTGDISGWSIFRSMMSDSEISEFGTIYDRTTAGKNELKEFSGIRSKPKPSSVKAIPKLPKRSFGGRKWVMSDDLFTCDYVDKGRRDQYLGLSDGWRSFRMAFMAGTAKKFKENGQYLSADLLANYMGQLDRADGGWYEDDNFIAEAESVLARVGSA